MDRTLYAGTKTGQIRGDKFMFYPETVYTVRYKHTAGLLAIFGGMLGLHNFYLGKKDRAVTQLLITILGGLFCLGIGPCVSFVWASIDGIQIISGTVTLDADAQALIAD